MKGRIIIAISELRNFEGLLIYQFILQCYESRSVEKQVNPINFPKAPAFPPFSFTPWPY